MTQRFEYDIVQVKPVSQGWFQNQKYEYESILHAKAQDGWRLVTIVTPPIGVHGIAPYYELVFERPS